jgi:TPR repeat protein
LLKGYARPSCSRQDEKRSATKNTDLPATAQSKRVKANLLYQHAEEEWRRGRLKRAFHFFLVSAEAGLVAAFGNVGQFYDHGYGVRVNENAALRWYRRAYRSGDDTVANNIGCILGDRKKLTQALMWFHRAVRSGDADANLNIAKLCLHHKRDPIRTIRFLKKTCRARNVTKGSKEEARRILRQHKKVGQARR